MSDFSSQSIVGSTLAPPPSGPVAAPSPKPRRAFYVWHSPISITLSTGRQVKVGDVLRGADALAFEVAVANGESDRNYATPTDVDPEA